MRHVLNLLVLASLALMIALPAAADDGFYFGGSVGRTALSSGNTVPIEVKGDTNSYKVFLGYRFLKFFAVEGAYADLGSAKDTTNGQQNEAKFKGYHGEGIVLLPLGIADIFAKAGAFSYTSDFTSNVAGLPASASKDGTAPLYGAGVQFRIKSWAVRGEVEYFDVKNADHVYMYSVGGSYTF
jgi:OmpA family protein